MTGRRRVSEAVAAERPDTIIGISIPTTVEVEDQLDAVAPTTIVAYTDSWQDQLRTVADAWRCRCWGRGAACSVLPPRPVSGRCSAWPASPARLPRTWNQLRSRPSSCCRRRRWPITTAITSTCSRAAPTSPSRISAHRWGRRWGPWVLDDARRTLIEGGEVKPFEDAVAEFDQFTAG